MNKLTDPARCQQQAAPCTPGPACVAKFSLEWMLTPTPSTKREVPPYSDFTYWKLLIAGLHPQYLHRDLFHRVIERAACGACLPVRLSSSAALAGPPTSPSRGMPGIATIAPTGYGDGAGPSRFNPPDRQSSPSGGISPVARHSGLNILWLVDETR